MTEYSQVSTHQSTEQDAPSDFYKWSLYNSQLQPKHEMTLIFHMQNYITLVDQSGEPETIKEKIQTYFSRYGYDLLKTTTTKLGVKDL